MEGEDYIPSISAKDYYDNLRKLPPEPEIAVKGKEDDYDSISKSLVIVPRSKKSLCLEIVELEEEEEEKEEKSLTDTDRVGRNDDVYVAVGKDDSDVVKWTLNYVLSPGARLYLLHVYPPVTYIPTPVGNLARSQLTKEQVRFYLDEVENRRRNLLKKYIELCNDAKVHVDTVLVEHNSTAKAIVDLIPIHNINYLVMGKKIPNLRILKKKVSKGEYVKKNAPEFCQVTIVSDETRVVHLSHQPASSSSGPETSNHDDHITRHSERNLFVCACFSACLR
ncbi:U-box domain-containing protein 52-like [Humulus lupulus]|uniref:U-box domain-containing protein 52-like n=1 Tax=Humulus lupulus TaxID=3486 RepID=UPI002B4131AA|nr:U-box domain-containing protein 52-like [Humulus lupulus]